MVTMKWKGRDRWQLGPAMFGHGRCFGCARGKMLEGDGRRVDVFLLITGWRVFEIFRFMTNSTLSTLAKIFYLLLHVSRASLHPIKDA
jgi:hypothetical protein